MGQTRIVVWNSNGLQQHFHEFKAFIAGNNIDIVLILEMDFTDKSFVNFPKYKLYTTNHPAGTCTRRFSYNRQRFDYQTDFVQSTAISVQTAIGIVTFAAIYSPPKHSICLEQYNHFFNSLGQRFIADGN